MITVTEIIKRKNGEGESFIALILSGSAEAVKSKQTGKFYITSRKCSIPSTLSEQQAKALIGTQIPGTISRIPCEPYSFITDSGDEVELDFTYEYSDEAESVVESIVA